MRAALACVDYVVIFDDDTPHQVLEALRPAVLVKGGTTADVIGREIDESYAGRVAVTPAIPGLSTTSRLAGLASPLCGSGAA
jgi:D-beta-D-heptose 7-phosphate kinase/D-beta-D-heptose 1-phosphate adenosyltransferase